MIAVLLQKNPEKMDYLDATFYEFDGDEVRSLSGVVHEKAVRLKGSELKPDVDGIVGLHLGKADVSVGGREGDGVVDSLLDVCLRKLGTHLFRLKTRFSDFPRKN